MIVPWFVNREQHSSYKYEVHVTFMWEYSILVWALCWTAVFCVDCMHMIWSCDSMISFACLKLTTVELGIWLHVFEITLSLNFHNRLIQICYSYNKWWLVEQLMCMMVIVCDCSLRRFNSCIWNIKSLVAFTPLYYVVLQLAVVEDKCETPTLNYGLHTHLIYFVASLIHCYFQGRPGML